MVQGETEIWLTGKVVIHKQVQLATHLCLPVQLSLKEQGPEQRIKLKIHGVNMGNNN